MKTIHIHQKGLTLNPNPYSLPDGSLDQAQNVDIDAYGTIRTRKGFRIVQANIPFLANEDLIALRLFGDHYLLLTNKRVLALHSESNTFQVAAQKGATSTDLFESFQSLLFAADSGIHSISKTLEVKPTGLPSPFKPRHSLVRVGSDNSNEQTNAALPPKSQVIYRALYLDPETDQRSAPSFPVRISNNNAYAVNVSLRFAHPKTITNQHQLEIYRSATADLSQNQSASDELFMVRTLSIGSASSLNFTDTGTPTETPLYTNASQEGIQNANYPPPQAQSMCLHKGMACYANVGRRPSVVLKWAAPTTLGGRIQITDGSAIIEILVGPAENQSNSMFNAGDLASMMAVIQNHPDNNFLNAYDIRVEDLSEPRLLLESKNNEPFRILIPDDTEASRAFGAAFSPSVSYSKPLQVRSQQQLNRIYFSKFEQPHAVPLYRYISVGQVDKAILKIASFRNSLFVFKEDGLFRIDGDTFEQFSVSNFLKDFLLVSKDSLSLLEDQLYCLSNYGFARISEYGYESISAPIDDQILKQIDNQHFVRHGFSVGLTQEKKYVFFFKTSNQIQASQAYVYHSTIGQWTQWNKPAQAAGLDRDYRLLLFDRKIQALLKERNSQSPYDWRDESFEAQVDRHPDPFENRYLIRVPNPLPFPITEDTFFSQGLSYSQIESIESIRTLDPRFLIVSLKHPFLTTHTTPVEINKAIPIGFRYNRLFFDDPSMLKKINTITFLLGPSFQKQLRASYITDLSPYQQDTRLRTKRGLPFSTLAWGGKGFGGNQPISQMLRSFAPRNKNVFHWIQIGLHNNDLFSATTFLGMTIEFRLAHAKAL